MRADNTRLSTRPWVGVIAVFLLMLGVQQSLEHVVHDLDRQHQEVHVVNHLSTVRARLEGIINSNLLALQGLTAFIAVHPNINQDEFSRISRELVGEKHALRNIAGAPDMVISLMYPLQGNEMALGLDYRSHPTQSAAAMRTVKEKKMVLAGPLDLVQGGRGVIARAPVYIQPENDAEPRQLWGLLSSVLDADVLFKNAGLLESDSPLQIAIRGIDGAGREGRVFFGNPDIFDRSPLTLEVTLPNGSWYMAAEPVAGWHTPHSQLMAVRISSLLIALLGAGVIYFRLRNGIERRQSEIALRERESILESVFQSLPDLYFRMQPDGTIVDYRAHNDSDLYLSPQQFLGHRMQDILPTELGELFLEQFRLVSKNAGVVTYEYDLTVNNVMRHFEARLTRLENSEQMIMVVRDVDDQYRAKMALKQSESSYRQLFESTGTAMCLMQEDGTLSLVNTTFAELAGKSKQELVGNMKFAELIMPEDRHIMVRQQQKNYMTAGTVPPSAFEFRYAGSKRNQGWGLALVSRIPGSLESIASIIDITSLKRADSELSRELNEKRQILETTMDGYILADYTGKILDVNSAYCEIVGYTRNELLQLNIRDLEAQFSDAEVDEKIRQLIQEGPSRFETKHRMKSGSEVQLEVSISVMPGIDSGLFNAFVRDITARKQAEEALSRTQKMDAIGQLTGGIAHDFNNILGIIIGNLGLLQQLVTDDAKILKRVDTANKAALRAADLTKQLLGFSRKQANNTAASNLNDEILGMQSLIARSMTPEVELELKLEDQLWPTLIDSGDFQDALLNIILNARDAMPTGGRLVIESKNCRLQDAITATNTTLPPGEYVKLVISDTGVGISADNLHRIFEPFYTTKAPGKGTGLGMSMVFGFIERSKGYIKAASEPGAGTSICIYLPRYTEVATAIDSVAKSETRLPGGNETILIVDDEDDLLELAQIYLQDLGYQTIIAHNAGSALRIINDSPGIDVLFSDVVMPGGMNGYELATQAVKLQPQLKLLLTSGFTSNEASQNDYAGIKPDILNKPYKKSDLAYKLRQILDENLELKHG